MIADDPTGVVPTTQRHAGRLDELDAIAQPPLPGDPGPLPAHEDDRGSFHPGAHHARLATPGPSVPTQIAAWPLIPDTASAMNPADSS